MGMTFLIFGSIFTPFRLMPNDTTCWGLIFLFSEELTHLQVFLHPVRVFLPWMMRLSQPPWTLWPLYLLYQPYSSLEWFWNLLWALGRFLRPEVLEPGRSRYP